MEKRLVRAALAAAVFLAVLILAVPTMAGFIPDVAGTKVYLTMRPVVPPTHAKRADSYFRKAKVTLDFRVSRSDMSGVEISTEKPGELSVKAYSVPDPEEFKRFLSRRGEWSLNGDDGQSIITLKDVKKTLADVSSDLPKIVVFLYRLPSGMAKGAHDGDVIPVTMTWDDEKIPFSMTVTGGGKTLVLSSPDVTKLQAWYIRAALSLGPYPCEMQVTEFKYGDDILKEIFG